MCQPRKSRGIRSWVACHGRACAPNESCGLRRANKRPKSKSREHTKGHISWPLATCACWNSAFHVCDFRVILRMAAFLHSRLTISFRWTRSICQRTTLAAVLPSSCTPPKAAMNAELKALCWQGRNLRISANPSGPSNARQSARGMRWEGSCNSWLVAQVPHEERLKARLHKSADPLAHRPWALGPWALGIIGV